MLMSRRGFLKGLGAIATAAAVVAPVSASLVNVAGSRVYVQASESFDYYISTTGNNTNDGLTPATAWNITSLIGTSHTSYNAQIGTNRGKMVGKKIGLVDGTYDVSTLWNNWFNGSDPLFQPPSGSSGAPTVIKAVNRQQAIIDGIDTSTLTKSTTCIGAGPGGNTSSNARAGYVTIDGLHIRNVGRPSNQGSNGIGFVYSSAQPGVRVINCRVQNVRGATGNNVAGIAFQSCNAYFCSNNWVHDIYGTSTSDHEGYAVWQWTCTGTSIVEYLTAYNVASGFYPKQINHGAYILRYCYLEPTAAHEGIRGGLSAPSAADCKVHNNIFFTSLLSDGEGYTNPVVENLWIYNNTFYSTTTWNTGGGGAYSVGFNDFPDSSVRHFNNIYRRAGGSGSTVALHRRASSFVVSNRNCYTSGDTLALAPSGSSTAYTPAQLNSNFGLDTNSIVADPLLVSPSTQNPDGFRLTAVTSPCLNAGRNYDVDGLSTCDMGAYGNGTHTRVGFSMAA